MKRPKRRHSRGVSYYQFGWKSWRSVARNRKFARGISGKRDVIALVSGDRSRQSWKRAKSAGEIARLNELEAIEVCPDYAEAHYNLGILLKDLNQLGEAEKSLQQALALNPEHTHAQHVLASIVGETTDAAPIEYVEKLFDNYAEQFESSLVGGLGYQIPTRIVEIMWHSNDYSPLGPSGFGLHRSVWRGGRRKMRASRGAGYFSKYVAEGGNPTGI